MSASAITAEEPNASGPHRAQLYWQCRRGMLELDYMLRNYLDCHFDTLQGQKLIAFEGMLEFPDAVLLEWFMGRIAPFDTDIADLVEEIRNTAAN